MIYFFFCHQATAKLCQSLQITVEYSKFKNNHWLMEILAKQVHSNIL